MGLFATKDFCKNDFITRYVGKTISWAEAKRRKKSNDVSHVRRLLPFVSAVDGDTKGVITPGKGGGSWINDPRDNRKVNSTYETKELSRSNPTPIIVMKATKNIKRGTEIFASYGAGYWRQ
jgi:hypothetical protein